LSSTKVVVGKLLKCVTIIPPNYALRQCDIFFRCVIEKLFFNL